MNNFWKTLPRPFSVLAPLDGVTDIVFRQMIVKIGKPDVLFTEFTSVDGIVSTGRRNVLDNLLFKPNEQPIVAQIWGTDPEKFYTTAKLVKKLGFAGIDINMGCPDRTVIKNGACSALIKNHSLAAEIIQATREGAAGIPLSVKTRIGFYKESVDEWIGFLLQQNLAALTVHLRTVEEMSKAPAHWELMPEIKHMRDKMASQTILIGNGDIRSRTEIEEKYQQYDIEGFMIGRGIFSNPWMFNKSVNHEQITINQRLNLYLEHIKLFENTWYRTSNNTSSKSSQISAIAEERDVKRKNPAIIRKFCKTYINNFDGASSMRERMMETKNIEELKSMALYFIRSVL